MKQITELDCRPRFTVGWLGARLLYTFAVALFLSLFASAIESFASSRVADKLLQDACYILLSQSVAYCFGIILITCISLILIEVAFRKTINYLQYSLIALSLTLFYLLLLAISEHFRFVVSYIIVSVMTVALIALFIKGITQSFKAMSLTAVILSVEYGMVLVLIMLGSMSLLVGSLSLFLLLAIAMYFTLKLRFEDEELVIK